MTDEKDISCLQGINDFCHEYLHSAEIELKLARKAFDLEDFSASYRHCSDALAQCIKVALTQIGIHADNLASATRLYIQKFTNNSKTPPLRPTQSIETSDYNFANIADCLHSNEVFFHAIKSIFLEEPDKFHSRQVNIENPLDLRESPCPHNYMRAYLALSTQPISDDLIIYLALGEASTRVPRSLGNDGFQILEKIWHPDFCELRISAKRQ